jgi:hypothetical protein
MRARATSGLRRRAAGRSALLSACAAYHPDPVEALRFSTIPRQLRGLRIFVIIVAAVAVALAVAAFRTETGLGGRLGAYAVGAAIGALVGGWAYEMYARAFTECSPARILTRGLAGQRQCPWAEVASIMPQPYGQTVTVLVSTTGGTKFRLGTPLAGGAMGDLEFGSKVRKIRDYWRSQAQRPARGRYAGTHPRSLRTPR